jgi:outer membrane protein OmpA-like peptidoglycan-associated protein
MHAHRSLRLAHWPLALLLACHGALFAADSVDVGGAIPQADAVGEGLFPEEKCEKLKAAGFQCQGFKPSVRYSLPATSFKIGSAELPDLLKKQLDVFAEVLKTRRGSGKVVRIEGHADKTGSEDFNRTLSIKRAEAVKEYLVSLGADPEMLAVAGVGSSEPKNSTDPFAPENRRVEIGRQAPP